LQVKRLWGIGTGTPQTSSDPLLPGTARFRRRQTGTSQHAHEVAAPLLREPQPDILG